MSIRDEQLLVNSTVNASGASNVFNNDGRSVWVLVVRNGAPSGTTPTLTFALMVSVDGTNFVQAGPNLTALNAAGSQRTVYAINSAQGPIVEPFVKVTWAIGGSASPSFPSVFADLIGM